MMTKLKYFALLCRRFRTQAIRTITRSAFPGAALAVPEFYYYLHAASQSWRWITGPSKAETNQNTPLIALGTPTQMGVYD